MIAVKILKKKLSVFTGLWEFAGRDLFLLVEIADLIDLRFCGTHDCVSQWLVRYLDNPLCLLNQRINQTFAVGVERNIEMYPDVATVLN